MGILIVDDSEDELLLLDSLLKNAGHKNVFLAESAIKGLDILKNSPTSSGIDIVLMDINMPGMDGIEACYKMQEDVRLKDIPVVIGAEQGQALRQGETESLMKDGRFSGYGFREISEIGYALEQAAKQDNKDEIKRGIDELEDYVRRVEVINEPVVPPSPSIPPHS